DTRVIPARLRGRSATGGRIELLALHPGVADAGAKPRWICMAKPAKRLHSGVKVTLDGGAHATVTRALENGRCEVEIDTNRPFVEYLQQHGEVPLPPYIRRPSGPQSEDRLRYQTIFARPPGAVAAPTAGLHFTAELVDELRRESIEIVTVTLHVG